MLAATDHPAAPWHVVAAESKPYARATVPETVISTIEHGLRAIGREPIQAEASL